MTVHYVLGKMAREDEEMVCEGNQCWVGDHRTSLGVMRKLLRIMAIKDVSDTKGLQRYVINETGRAILRRPDLGNEIFYHVFCARGPFKVDGDRIVPLDN